MTLHQYHQQLKGTKRTEEQKGLDRLIALEIMGYKWVSHPLEETWG